MAESNLSDDEKWSQDQLTSVLEEDATHVFDTMIAGLMSPMKEERYEAEVLFNLCQDTYPHKLSLRLVHRLQFSQGNTIRAMCALLLRINLTHNDSTVQPFVSISTHLSLRRLILSCSRSGDSELVTRMIGDVVCELASIIHPRDDVWTDLFDFLSVGMRSDSAEEAERVFLIFSRLSQSQYVPETMYPYIKHLRLFELLRVHVYSPNQNVKVAASNSIITFRLDLSKWGDQFKNLLLMIILEEPGPLKLLIELAETNPRFFHKHFSYLLSFMLVMTEKKYLNEGTKHLSLEFAITLAEASKGEPAMMEEIIHSLFEVLMRMLLDVEDNPDWHIKKTNAEETSDYSIGQESLNRLASSLGGNTILPVALAQMEEFLVATEWKNRHAALIMLAQIAEGCSEAMIRNLNQVVTPVLSLFHDPHERVRWASINAIGELSKYLGPHLQNQHQDCLPSLLASAMDDLNPCVQARAASAVFHFCKNSSPNDMELYVDRILDMSFVLLQSDQRIVREGALYSLASVGVLMKKVTQSKKLRPAVTHSRRTRINMNKSMTSLKKSRIKLRKVTSSLKLQSTHWTHKLDSLEQLCVSSVISAFTLLGETITTAQRYILASNIACACVSFCPFVYRKVVPKRRNRHMIDGVLFFGNLVFALCVFLWFMFAFFHPRATPPPPPPVCPSPPVCPPLRVCPPPTSNPYNAVRTSHVSPYWRGSPTPNSSNVMRTASGILYRQRNINNFP